MTDQELVQEALDQYEDVIVSVSIDSDRCLRINNQPVTGPLAPNQRLTAIVNLDTPVQQYAIFAWNEEGVISLDGSERLSAWVMICDYPTQNLDDLVAHVESCLLPHAKEYGINKEIRILEVGGNDFDLSYYRDTIYPVRTEKDCYGVDARTVQKWNPNCTTQFGS